MSSFTINSAVTGQRLVKMPMQWDEFVKKYRDILTKEQMEAIAIDRAANPLRYYCPNGRQEEFIKLISGSIEHTKIPVCTLFAGNGIGKSYNLMNILANIILGCQNGWFDYPLFHSYPFNKICWNVSTKTAMEGVFMPFIRANFPSGSYEISKRGKPYENAVKFSNGWEVFCFTFDQDVSVFESVSVGLITIDEPCSEAIWKALKSRVRMGAVRVISCTPLETEPFFQTEISNSSNKNRYFTMMASVYDACKERGVRGHLDAKIIDDMVSEYSEDEKESRIYGKFMYFSERIYKLDDAVHLVEPVDYPLDWVRGRCHQVVDPHDGRESAAGWGMIQPIVHSDGYLEMIAGGKARQQFRYIIFGEYPEWDGTPFWELRRTCTLGEEVERWCAMEDWLWSLYKSFADERSRLPVHSRVIDKHFGFQTRGGKTLANIYADEGRRIGRPFSFIASYTNKSADGEIAFGHDRVRELLLPLEDGKPGLVVYNTCRHVWNGLTHYVRKRMRGIDGDKAIGDTKIIERFKDFPDFVRYFSCISPAYYLDDDMKPESVVQTQYRTHEKDPMKVLGSMF